MNFSSYRVLYFWALCLLSMSVDSLVLYPIPERKLIPIPQRKTCCNNVNRRTVFLEHRAPSLDELVQMAKDTMKTSSLHEAEKDPFSTANKFGLSPPPFNLNDESLKKMEDQKAYICSKLSCSQQSMQGPVCACNFNTGNVVTFKNRCDMKKHNCRFDTAFKAILQDICPWEFESRRRERSYDYSESKYYN